MHDAGALRALKHISPQAKAANPVTPALDPPAAARSTSLEQVPPEMEDLGLLRTPSCAEPDPGEPAHVPPVNLFTRAAHVPGISLHNLSRLLWR